MTIMSNGLEIGLRNWVGVAMTIFVRERKWHSCYVSASLNDYSVVS